MVEAARVMGFSEDKVNGFSDVNEALADQYLRKETFFSPRHPRSASLIFFVKELH